MNNKLLIREQNIISLRTAIVIDDGNLVSFILMSSSFESSIPGDEDFEQFNHTWLFRKKKSFWREIAMRRGFFPVEQSVKTLIFKGSFKIRLVWTNSGHSVALYLNEEPWAFIHEGIKDGYSKGIIQSTVGNPWDQALFEKSFDEK